MCDIYESFGSIRNQLFNISPCACPQRSERRWKFPKVNLKIKRVFKKSSGMKARVGRRREKNGNYMFMACTQYSREHHIWVKKNYLFIFFFLPQNKQAVVVEKCTNSSLKFYTNTYIKNQKTTRRERGKGRGKKNYLLTKKGRNKKWKWKKKNGKMYFPHFAICLATCFMLFYNEHLAFSTSILVTLVD